MCDCAPQIIPSEQVLKKLRPDEKILFTGSYFRPDFNEQYDGVASTTFMKISVNPAGSNVVSVNNFIIKPTPDYPFNFLTETFWISSWNKDAGAPNRSKVGIIQFTSLYNNAGSDTSTTSADVERYVVNGTFGIYENVTGVLIQFNEDLTRVLYFLGKC